MARWARTVLHAEADSFVPDGQGVYDRQITSKLRLTKPDEREITLDATAQLVQQRSPELAMAKHLNEDFSLHVSVCSHNKYTSTGY